MSVNVKTPENGACLLVICLSLICALSLSTVAANAQGPWTQEPGPAAAGVSSLSEGYYGNETMSTGFEAFDIAGQEPSALLVAGEMVAFADYVPRGNELWFQGTSAWAQRVVCPLGSSLKMIAYTPDGGNARLYRALPDKDAVSSRDYMLGPGYSRMTYVPDATGRTILVLSVEEQPGNAIFVDVLPGEDDQGYTDVKGVLAGPARVTVISEELKGFDVSVDGTFRTRDGADGVVDGTATLTVSGGKDHAIKISIRRGPEYTYTMKFESGKAYALKFPP